MTLGGRSDPLKNHSLVVKDFALETLLITIEGKRFNFIVEILVEKKVSKRLYGRE